jgi:hypothetical protein
MAALLFIGLAVVTPAFAKKHAFPNGQGLTVTSVDTVNSKISFKLQDNKQTLTYNLPLGTVITINREPATLNQIKPGMSVLSYTEGDGQDLSQIDVGGKKRK